TDSGVVRPKGRSAPLTGSCHGPGRHGRTRKNRGTTAGTPARPPVRTEPTPQQRPEPFQGVDVTEERCIRMAVDKRGLSPDPAGLADSTAEDAPREEPRLRNLVSNG